MSIPAIFSPVHYGEKVYVDGGLVGNLPTDVVRAMGADIVSGVHLEVAQAKASDIQSLVSVLGRSIDVVIRKWREYLERRDARKHTSVPVPEYVKVEGVDPETEKNIERFLRPLVGKSLETGCLDHLLTRLAGIGKFSRLGYRISRNNGQDGLVVTVHEKIYAPPLLQLGFEVDGSEIADVTFTQAARVTFMDVAGYSSEWRNDFLFGNTYGFQTERYKPLSAVSNWFFAPHAGLSDAAFRIYDKNNPRAEYRVRNANAALDLG